MIRGRAAAAAVAIAERIERARGARAGLVAWKTAAATSAEVRGQALVSALRCAVSLSDFVEVAELTRRWALVEGGTWDAAIASLCKTLARAGQLPRAVVLAETEARRHPSALSLYAYARCLEVSRDDSATGVFAEAALRAEREGRREIEMAARLRRMMLLARSWRSMGEAFEEARRIDSSAVPPTSRIAIARVLLQSPSRFVRASALGLLDQIIETEKDSLVKQALSVVARWVDDLGGPVSLLEEDRLFALLGRERSRMVAPSLRDAITNILAAVKSAEGVGLAWEAADVERLAETRLRNAMMGAPAGGFLRIADALAKTQKAALAAEAYRAALVRKEPGARESFGMFRLREGWAQAQAGKREEATLALREAKALLAPA